MKEVAFEILMVLLLLYAIGCGVDLILRIWIASS